jgi:hypothetical protein
MLVTFITFAGCIAVCAIDLLTAPATMVSVNVSERVAAATALARTLGLL